jgi:amidase
MQVVTRDKVIYRFSPANPPVATVSDGEEFWVETNDCYSGQIRTEKDLRPNIDTSIMNAATGPIAVRGTAPGDTICVEVREIELGDYGIMPTNPGLGPLGDRISAPDTKIIPVRDGWAHFSPTLRLPLRPMVGVLGVAPAAGEIHCVVPGDHGANMDTKDIRAGSKVYLPVFVAGANVAVADLHACMGDGELSGTGIEIAGRVRLSVARVAGLALKMPVVESEDAFFVVASDGDFRAAAVKAIGYAADIVGDVLALSFPDAYRLVSAACDLRVSQMVNPQMTVRVAIPKYVLPRLG